LPEGNENITDTLIYEAVSNHKDEGEYIEYMGDNLFKVSKRIGYGISIVNDKGEWLINYKDLKNERYVTAGKSYNNIFTMEKADGSISIMDAKKPKGEIIKTFNKPDSSWELWSSIGSNIMFYDRKNNKYIFYRGISGKYFVYDYVGLTDNNEAIVQNGVQGDESCRYYILNADGTIKFDAGAKGYKSIEKIDGFDFYKVFKDNGESGLCDIVDKKGNVIKTNVNKNLNVDKSGVFAYVIEGNLINFFDFFGDDIGKIKLGDIYGDNFEIDKIDFINGMLFVDSKLKNFYVTPYGKIL